MTGQARHRYDLEWSPVETLAEILTSATRYDFALWAIPTAFLLALVAGSVLGIPSTPRSSGPPSWACSC